MTLRSILPVILLCPLLLTAQPNLQRAINTLVNDSELKHATVGICVIDVESGKVIGSHQPDISVIPASSLKVVTTATILGLLGPDHTFKTVLQYDGTITPSGELNGNLYLKGYGDPTLGSDQMKGAAEMDEILTRFRLALQQKGIRRINGYIIGDASYFGTDANSTTWQWNDMGNYYGAGIWALNMHENLYYLHFQQSGKLGATPPISLIEPEVPGLEFTNEVRSAGRGTGDNAYIYGSPYTYRRFVRGTIPVGSGRFTIKGSLPDPPYFAAYHLKNNLESIGITSTKGPITYLDFTEKGGKSGQRKILLTHHSPKLSEIVERANMKSVNLYVEAFLRAIGKAKKEEGNGAAGLEVIEEYWKDRGLRMDGCFLDDGSGLSARNVVTTRFMASLMRKVAMDNKIYPHFNASLPLAGRSGSLKFAMRGTAGEGNIRAKSGTLKRVRSFTGYATSRSGKLLAFSVIVNNFNGSGGAMRRKLERFMVSLCQ